MARQAVDLNDYPLILSGESNFHNQEQEKEEEEEEEASPLITERDWIKIGNEYLQNPVATFPSEPLIFKDLLVSGNKATPRKRKFEAGYEEEAVYTFVPESMPEIEDQHRALVKNSDHNLTEMYVQLCVINRFFMSKTEGVEEEEEEYDDDDSTSYFCFRTKRRYLYYD